MWFGENDSNSRPRFGEFDWLVGSTDHILWPLSRDRHHKFHICSQLNSSAPFRMHWNIYASRLKRRKILWRGRYRFVRRDPIDIEFSSSSLEKSHRPWRLWNNWAASGPFLLVRAWHWQEFSIQTSGAPELLDDLGYTTVPGAQDCRSDLLSTAISC